MKVNFWGEHGEGICKPFGSCCFCYFPISFSETYGSVKELYFHLLRNNWISLLWRINSRRFTKNKLWQTFAILFSSLLYFRTFLHDNFWVTMFQDWNLTARLVCLWRFPKIPWAKAVKYYRKSNGITGVRKLCSLFMSPGNFAFMWFKYFIKQFSTIILLQVGIMFSIVSS